MKDAISKLKSLTKFGSKKKEEKPVVEKNPGDRETWSGRFDFFLSALAYAVGLGAVWRFPYLCYKNGGGVFLIPYFVCLVLVGIPLVFLELCVGQFRSTGPLTCWNMVPIFRGIGACMNITNGYLAIYYNMIIAYSFYYLVLSFTSKLPWETCSTWSSPNCLDDYSTNFTYVTCDNANETFSCENGKCYNLTGLDGSLTSCSSNDSIKQSVGWYNPQYPSQDYWIKVILQRSSGIEDTAGFVWQLFLALVFAWLVVFLMVVRGIKVSGKLVYFTSLFPYVVLLILGIRGWMLPGADIGINYYIKPDFSKLGDVNVWIDAASQIFFTLSVAYGGLVALSSYNDFNNNIMRDAIFVSISNCLTSVFAGFVVFAFLGYLSHVTGQPVDQVVEAGQGLAFIVYPYAVTTISGAPFWAILFFIMMIVLGLDTMMASVETTITSVLDVFPWLKQTKLRRFFAISGICLFFMVFGILFCLRSGTYWVEIFNTYSGGWSVLLLGALESISIAWFYGLNNFKKDISLMLGTRITNNKFFYIWYVLWFAITPGLLVALVALSFKDNVPIDLGDYKFPYWSHVLGNIMTVSVLFGVVFWPIYQVIDALFIHKKPLLSLIRPDYENYIPQKPEHIYLMKKIHNLPIDEKVFNAEIVAKADGLDVEKF